MKGFTIALLAGAACAYPGMKGDAPPGEHHAGIFKAIIQRAGERHMEEQAEWMRKRSLLDPRQAPPPGGPPPARFVLLGDLQEAGTGGSAVNDQIMSCLRHQNGTTCESHETYTPPKKDTPSCEKDTCCIWSYIKDDLVPLFQECDGTCNDVARACVRFGFHDAGAWKENMTHGGADGSLLLDEQEVLRPANAGLDRARNALLPIWKKYKGYGISAADLVQFAHNVAVTTCPLGPRTLTYVGRPDWKKSDGPNEDGLLPDANDLADNLINLFANKTITSIDLVALIGAHTAGKQRFFDPSKADMPFDTTPGVWDVAFYSELLNGTTPNGVFHLPSDQKFPARVNSTRNAFLAMANGFPVDQSPGQIQWDGLYSKGYLRLSLLGVKKIQGLTDCTKVLPTKVVTFDGPRGFAPTCQKDEHIKVPDNSTLPFPDGKNGTITVPSKTPGASGSGSGVVLPTDGASTTSSSGPVQATANAASSLQVVGGGFLSLVAAAVAFAL